MQPQGSSWKAGAIHSPVVMAEGTGFMMPLPPTGLPGADVADAAPLPAHTGRDQPTELTQDLGEGTAPLPAAELSVFLRMKATWALLPDKHAKPCDAALQPRLVWCTAIGRSPSPGLSTTRPFPSRGSILSI